MKEQEKFGIDSNVKILKGTHKGLKGRVVSFEQKGGLLKLENLAEDPNSICKIELNLNNEVI